MDFYNASPLTQAYMRKIGMAELNEISSNVTVLVWLSSLFDLPKEKVNTLIEAYSELNTLNNFGLLNAPISEKNA